MNLVAKEEEEEEEEDLDLEKNLNLVKIDSLSMIRVPPLKHKDLLLGLSNLHFSYDLSWISLFFSCQMK
jgi:hypothetical protein